MNDESDAGEQVVSGAQQRLLFPIVGLKLSSSWSVGPVSFDPASTASEMASMSGSTQPIVLPVGRESAALSVHEIAD
jgi:hypothetical protein